MSSSDTPHPPTSDDQIEYDPIFLNSRREAILIFCVWLACFAWSVPYCYINGYHYDPKTFSTVWGIPSWLFWGIAVPWVISDIITTIICFCVIKNDDLGETNEDTDIKEEIAEMHAADKGGNK